jgi:hypothetical protein
MQEGENETCVSINKISGTTCRVMSLGGPPSGCAAAHATVPLPIMLPVSTTRSKEQELSFGVHRGEKEPALIGQDFGTRFTLAPGRMVRQRLRQWVKLCLLAVFCCLLQSTYILATSKTLKSRWTTKDGVQWKSCGDGFQCANITVPLNYHDASDGRTVAIAVTRLPASDKKNRRAR